MTTRLSQIVQQLLVAAEESRRRAIDAIDRGEGDPIIIAQDLVLAAECYQEAGEEIAVGVRRAQKAAIAHSHPEAVRG